jgi:bifunctional DNase/RNase
MREMLSAEIWSIAQTNQGSAVLLRPRGLNIAVPIFIGQLEIQSILIGREGVNLPRPLTHDLVLNVLQRMSLNIEKVEVHELRDNTFHARLVVLGREFTEEKPLIIDSRPSDAFALAVRRRCPILIDSKVVEQAGVPLEFFMEEINEAGDLDTLTGETAGAGPLPEASAGSTAFDARHRELIEMLNRAVEAEEYERAAEIRDMLFLLNRRKGDVNRKDEE